ncbi:MAG: hypothetical protein ACKVH0_06655, partial [Alphaproteobacteria bacterium]
RGLAKRPDVLVLNGATDAMDSRTRLMLVERILDAAPGGVVWAMSDTEQTGPFDRVAEVADGKVKDVTGGDGN